MKRVAIGAALAVVLLAGCVVPGRAAIVATVPAPVVIPHVHGPHCGHLWGFWGGRPIYFDRGHYSYWNGALWVESVRPPVVYHTRIYRPDPSIHYHYRQRATQQNGSSAAPRAHRGTAHHNALPAYR